MHSERQEEPVNIYNLIHSMTFLMAPLYILYTTTFFFSVVVAVTVAAVAVIIVDSIDLFIRIVKNFKSRNNLATLNTTWLSWLIEKMRII